MKARDVMVKDVITVGPDDEVARAARLLADHDISALPVVDADRRIMGILSEADLLHREEIGTTRQRPRWLEAFLPASTLAADYSKAHGRKVAELMSVDVISASPDASLSEIATLLERHRIKRVPIVEGERLVGVVSRANLIQALASAPHLPEHADGDRAIRLEIMRRLSEQRWTSFGERNVVVNQGVAHLWGLVGSADERRALVALAESTPGVHSVVDEMIPCYW